MKPRRVLTRMPLQVLTAAHLDELRALAAAYDEVVVVLPGAEEAFTEQAPLSAGERLGLLLPILRDALPRLPYLLPVRRGALSAAQELAQLRALCPDFAAVVCRGEAERALLAGALPDVRPEEPARRDLPALEQLVLRHLRRDRVLEGDPALAAFAQALAAQGLLPRLRGGAAAPVATRRGLLLTRAQPFHNGHRAFVRQMAAEEDEVVVVVAMAERSHTLEDPATCGERLEMIRPVLEREAPGRFHLLGAPFLPVAATNFADLRLLCPPFQRFYGTNPAARAMAAEAGCEVAGLREPVPVSGTELRRRIARDEPWEELVPEEVRAVLLGSPALARLRALAAGERR